MCTIPKIIFQINLPIINPQLSGQKHEHTSDGRKYYLKAKGPTARYNKNFENNESMKNKMKWRKTQALQSIVDSLNINLQLNIMLR